MFREEAYECVRVVHMKNKEKTERNELLIIFFIIFSRKFLNSKFVCIRSWFFLLVLFVKKQKKRLLWGNYMFVGVVLLHATFPECKFFFNHKTKRYSLEEYEFFSIQNYTTVFSRVFLSVFHVNYFEKLKKNVKSLYSCICFVYTPIPKF